MPPGTKSVTRSSAATDDIQDVARALSAEPVRAISEIRRGGNSRIFRVQTASARYALKKYPAADHRNRLEAEVNALRFMERKGIGRTPKVDLVAQGPQIQALAKALLAAAAAEEMKSAKDFQAALQDWMMRNMTRSTHRLSVQLQDPALGLEQVLGRVDISATPELPALQLQVQEHLLREIRKRKKPYRHFECKTESIVLQGQSLLQRQLSHFPKSRK